MRKKRREATHYLPGSVLESNGMHRNAYRYIEEDGYGVESVRLPSDEEAVFIVLALQRRQRRRQKLMISPRLRITTSPPEPKAYVLTMDDVCWITTV